MSFYHVTHLQFSGEEISYKCDVYGKCFNCSSAFFQHGESTLEKSPMSRDHGKVFASNSTSLQVLH